MLMKDLTAMLEETSTIKPLANSQRQDIARLAAFRMDTLRQRTLEKTHAFLDDMLRQHKRHRSGERDLNWKLDDTKLHPFRTHIMIENVVNFEGLLGWFDRDPEEVKARPQKYVREFSAELRQLIRVMGKVPKGCALLREQFISY